MCFIICIECYWSWSITLFLSILFFLLLLLLISPLIKWCPSSHDAVPRVELWTHPLWGKRPFYFLCSMYVIITIKYMHFGGSVLYILPKRNRQTKLILADMLNIRHPVPELRAWESLDSCLITRLWITFNLGVLHMKYFVNHWTGLVRCDVLWACRSAIVPV